jgi:5-oxoprolinase (ATP-hydrolysing)
MLLPRKEACAASQGDTNNLTFGFGGNMQGEAEEKGFGYYETIAGGSGAGPDWEGTSGVHTHFKQNFHQRTMLNLSMA